MSVNALRGHLSEFGIIASKGIGRVDELLDLAESDATLPAGAKAGVKVLASTLEGLDKAIDDLEGEITSGGAQSDMVRLLDKVPGVGKLIASAIEPACETRAYSNRDAILPPGLASHRSKTQAAAKRNRPGSSVGNSRKQPMVTITHERAFEGCRP